jgi:integrase
MSRKPGEGNIAKRTDGRWAARLYLPNGKRKIKYARTQKEAVALLHEMRKDLGAGRLTSANGSTVAEYLEQWLEHAQRDWRANTLVAATNSVRNHIIPTLGKLKLGQVKPLDIENAYRRMTHPKTKKKSTTGTVQYAHKMLRSAFRQAVRWQLIGHNPMDGVTTPKHSPDARTALTSEQVQAFLEHPSVASHQEFALWYVAFASGLRRGELLGLRWSDIDLERGVLRVRQQVIEVGQSLTLSIPLAPSTVTVLQEQQARVGLWQKFHGEDWHDFDLAFPLEDGRPRSPRGTSRMFRRLADSVDLPDLVLHETRHTAISLVAAQTRDARLVADFAGHTDATFTMNTYVHTDPARLGQAAIDLQAHKRLN